MSLIDLKCGESICLSTSNCYINNEKEVLFLGHYRWDEYVFYLYFNLLPYYCLRHLKQAKLILFKLPARCVGNEKCCRYETTQYSILPLLDFFGSYSYMYSPPNVDYSRRVNFDDKYDCAYAEVDITNIVKDWIGEKLENKGLLLVGNSDSQLITYASSRYNMVGMRPMLRLIYEENSICQPMSITPCDIMVDNNKS